MPGISSPPRNPSGYRRAPRRSLRTVQIGKLATGIFPVLRLSVAVSTLALLGCGAAPPPETSSIEPTTDRDPDPYRPIPEAKGRAGSPSAATLAIPIAGNEAIALAFLEAVRDGDRAALSRLLADPIHSAGVGHSRRSTIDRIVASRGVAVKVPPVAELVNTDAIRATESPGRARRARRNQPWTRPGDIVVVITLRRPGRLFFRQVLTPRWGAPRGTLWIRPDAPQPVIGF